MNGNISLVLAEDSGDFRLERAWAFPIFDFDNYRLPSADKIQHVIKQRDPLDGAGKAERRDFGGSRQAYTSVQAGESKQLQSWKTTARPSALTCTSISTGKPCSTALLSP